MRDHASAGQSEQLPAYSAERYHVDDEDGSHDMFRVVCPRRGCEGVFWVEPRWTVLRAEQGSSLLPAAFPYGRPCPYCSRASAIPEELRRRAPTTGRIVRRKRRKS